MSVTRPVFREGQVLTATEFNAERSARIDRLAGHANLADKAARIEAPDGRAVLALGQGPLRPVPELSVTFDQTPVLRIDAVNGGRIKGDITFAPRPAGVGVAAGASANSLVFSEATAPPEGPTPWSLRRVKTEVDGQPVDDLRLELHHPGAKGDPSRNRLLIGTAQRHLALDAEGRLTLFQNGQQAAAGIDVPPPGRIAFAPISPGPTDPAFALTLSSAMLQGILWALLLATLSSGVVGNVMINGEPAGDVTIRRGESEATSDAEGRFYLAAVGWPGESVILTFEHDGTELDTRAATVGAPAQIFAFEVEGFGGDII